MKKLFRPKIFIPLVLSASIIAALLAFGDVKKILSLLLGFQRQYLVYFFLLMLAYEFVRLMQWHYLLKTLGIRVSFKTQMFTFLAGEVAKTLPIGNYFSSYMLSQAKGTKLGRTTAISTVIIMVEVAVCLAGVVILGIADWGWLRPAILLGSFAAILIGWALLRFYDDAQPPPWMTRREGMRRALRELHAFRTSAAELMRPRILAIQIIFGAAYLTLAGIGLYVVMAGLGIQNVTILHAIAVYLFSLAVGLLIPIPIDVGLIEVSGIGALLAFGVARSDAVTTMLLFRVLSLASALAIALVAMLFLFGELRAALRDRKNGPRGEGDATDTEQPQEPTQGQQAPQSAGAV